ncbi:LysR family transcriptional regulator [Hydrogenophaga sp. 5NK40-0174]|uniref:LysR family transcriptional regulator n=1 Tax=Hydrogenophaga sp. 5NK40-0174 TaxID=3127649 RepID=UPI0031082E3B
MELRHLRYFEVLANTLNFTRAAEQLHIAQPPLSRQIQQLEDELGVMLIDRSSRPLALTRAGSFFFEQSTQVLARIEEMCEATRRLGAGRRRWLGVGFVPSMLYGALPKVVQAFMAQNPDIDVVLKELTSVQQAEALQAGRIDVGFGRLAVNADGLLNTMIFEETMVAALPASSPLARYKSLSLKQLSETTIILYPATPRPSFADQVATQFRAHGFPILHSYETNGLQTAIGLVAAGMGASVVPQSVQRLTRDDITYRPISNLGVVSPVLMTTRVGDTSQDLSTLCAAVVKACRASANATASPSSAGKKTKAPAGAKSNGKAETRRKPRR